MNLVDSQHSVLLENVFNLILKKVDQSEAKLAEQFARILFKNISLQDVENRNDSDLYGAILSLWHEFVEFKQDSHCIRVVNPDLAQHGWHSTHTIVQIVVRDMPFLVDSVRMVLNRLGITAYFMLHMPLKVKRDKDGRLTGFADKGETTGVTKETVFLIEVDRQTTNEALKALSDEVHSVVDEVAMAVSDWEPMSQRLAEIIKGYAKAPSPASKAQRREAEQFLRWLADHNFTLMGYRGYQAKAIKGDYRWIPEKGSSLGLMKNSETNRDRLLSNLPQNARDETLSANPLMLTKTTTKSRVHRPAYLDYVGIKRFDEQGNVVGEDRFIGLYSAQFYNSSATQLPFLKDKVMRLGEMSGFPEGSHVYKAFLNVLETYPRDELLQASEPELVNTIKGILQMQERGISRLFVRKDVFGKFYSCMVYVPRERYNTQLRKETQELLQKALGSDEEVEFTTYFSESVYARTHYIARVKDNSAQINVKDIEKNMIELTKSWNDKLNATLLETHGEEKAKSLKHQYDDAFARSYKEHNLPSVAVVDIDKLERLSDTHTLDMLFYRPQEENRDSERVKLKLFHRNQPIHLSDVLPMLENFGLRVIDESPYQVKTSDGRVNWIMDFSMLHKNSNKMSMGQAQSLFQTAFSQVWYGHLEDDAFNKLVLGAGIAGRKVTILRSYAKYMRQTGSSFSVDYIAGALERYPAIAAKLIALFEMKFDPASGASDKQVEGALAGIRNDLEQVANLDDDRIIRRYLDMMLATLRTNFFQSDNQGNEKPYVSFKFMPELIPEMPLPLPKYEIFVYSPRVEGVHLRGGKVARGGLRWSDRQEDFRTEVLGLVKAQQVKNTVIVPVGAKGGFVCKKLPMDQGRQAMLEEGKECYRTFIRGLLDITDNIVKGEVVPPRDVVRLDEDDSYLVVAADKGTATFSDIANALAEEYNFWLGDAFASGGSVGYDHKGMGITARGAWESVKRHFREMGIDCQTTDFTCLAIGDMAGDVFGNGMLLSEHTRLVCAFNHLHIFFDPTPDAASSYKERQRLFDNPSLGWDDYDKSLISKGGGIFSRAAKSITLTPEMKKALGTKKAQMTPNELIHNALQMKVDLIWNGGIGTYVKATKESHAEVGDRANDDTRVNGNQVRAKIVGEGGNLGLTQLGRVEYANNGGRVNTDFIDNVGGVDCSDNEVNIKILLNALVREGELTIKQRNKLLYDMTDDVAELVLDDCYRQTESMSVTHMTGGAQLKEQLRFIHRLEKDGRLNRELEFIPNDEEISERLASGNGLTRPELSVLISYGKMVLKEELNVPAITANDYHNRLLLEAFPKVLREKFADQMQEHPLRGEIIATKLANKMLNTMGLNFAVRMQEETGASFEEIANAFTVINGVFGMDNLWSSVETLDNQVSAQVQLSMLDSMRRTLRRATRWFIRHGDKSQAIQASIDAYHPVYLELQKNLKDYLVKDELADLEDNRKGLVKAGVPKALAAKVASLSNMFSCLDLAQVCHYEDRPVSLVATLYFHLGSKLELHWFLDQINRQSVGNHWQALARASFREELDWQQRALTAVVLRNSPKGTDASQILDTWMEQNEVLLSRWYHMMSEFKTSTTHEFAKFSVALRELMMLSLNCG